MPRLRRRNCRRSPQALRRLLELARRLPGADTDFHRIIVSASGNATLASLIQNLSGGTLRARLWHSLVERGAVEVTRASHHTIYNALLARDADMASAADLMHLGASEEWLRRLVEQEREPR